MMDDLAVRTQASLAALGMLPESRLVVGVSGGMDSMSLATVVASIHPAGLVTVAHFNHKLRGEDSDRDEQLVREFCHERSLRFVAASTSSALPASNIEEHARAERYAFLEATATTAKADFVLTAHTANDQAETVLMRLMRSAGPKGLAGIPHTRTLGAVTILRPWLGVTRKEIEEYARTHNVHYSEDASNQSLDFERNRVRHILMPALHETFPNRNAIDVLGTFADRMSHISDFLLGAAGEEYSRVRKTVGHPLLKLNRVGIDLSSFEKLDMALKPLVLELAFKEIGFSGMHRDEAESLRTFIPSSEQRIRPRLDLLVMKESGILIFERLLSATSEFEELPVNHTVITCAGSISAFIADTAPIEPSTDTAFFDLSGLKQSILAVRTWKDGDEIQPFGMKGTRKVADLLREAGVAEPDHRRITPLVVLRDEPSRILWVPGVRAAEFARVTPGTSRVLILRREQYSGG